MTTHGGRRGTGIDAIEWCARAAELGAGEILLNSMDADGTRDGFDLALIRRVRARGVACRSSPAGAPARWSTSPPAVEAGADAVLAASVFHFGELDHRRGQGRAARGRLPGPLRTGGRRPCDRRHRRQSRRSVPAEGGHGLVRALDRDPGHGLPARGVQQELARRAAQDHDPAPAGALRTSRRPWAGVTAPRPPASGGRGAGRCASAVARDPARRSRAAAAAPSPAAARSTSSWCTKNSARLTTASTASNRVGDHGGGPVRTRSTSSGQLPAA